MNFIYMLRAGETHYKVGITNNIVNRIKSMQTANQYPIEVVISRPVSDASAVEGELHKWLKDCKTGGGTEWFEMDLERAMDLVIKISNIEIEADLADHLAIRRLTLRLSSLERKLAEKDPEVAKAAEENSQPEKPEKLLFEAEMVLRSQGRVSASLLQRRLRVGYSRAARIIDLLEDKGVVGPSSGYAPRKLLK